MSVNCGYSWRPSHVNPDRSNIRGYPHWRSRLLCHSTSTLSRRGSDGHLMPEFYDQGTCRYQLAAQPYLAAIARGVRSNSASRAFMLNGTEYAKAYAEADVLWREQWSRRDAANSMKCPFWSNYWSEPCQSCDCRINKSVSMEIDAMFFLHSTGKTLAIHVEMKRDGEALRHGQAEAYRPRAACYRDQRRVRAGVLPHDHFVTVLFCGRGTDISEAEHYFDRVITHESARTIFPDYPAK